MGSYKKDLPRRMYTYFISYEGPGAPSFRKFAGSIGVTLAELLDYRRKPKFNRAYAECNEIRRDYLIDTALSKRSDATITKFLLQAEYGMGERSIDSGERELHVTLDVLGEDGNGA